MSVPSTKNEWIREASRLQSVADSWKKTAGELAEELAEARRLLDATIARVFSSEKKLEAVKSICADENFSDEYVGVLLRGLIRKEGIPDSNLSDAG